jgi:shikimate kinase
MKIFLIGMSGSGKTTLGKRLANELRTDFVDLDWEIEKREGKSVKEIFSQFGEDYFRTIEAEVLRSWASAPSDFVMSTGGGAPCFFKGIDIINEAGLSIFLDVPVEELKTRLAAATDRPLLNAGDEAERESKLNFLRTSRLSTYRKAHISVEDATLEKLLSVIPVRN